MKNKKIWVRIGSIFACVLLVSLLAIPAFADETPQAAAEDINTLYQYFVEAYTARVGNAGALFLPPDGEGKWATIFFDIPYMISGSILRGVDELYKPQPLVQLTTDLADFEIIETMSVSVVYGPYYDYQYKEYYDVPCRYMEFYSPEEGYTISFSIDIENGNDRITYKSTNPYDPVRTLALHTCVFDGVEYDITSGLVSFSALIGDSGTAMLAALDATFYGGNGFILYPRYYAEVGGSSAIAYDRGYTAGKTEGIEEGKNIGYQNGLNENNGYQLGYQEGTKDITSGQFARGFLGSILSAPFEALNNFTLVKWTTANGATITITLATIISAGIGVSLFVWFLKLFAGG